MAVRDALIRLKIACRYELFMNLLVELYGGPYPMY